MRLIEKRDGFSIVEALVVLGVIGILVAMGGSLAANYSIRKSVDRITGDISSSLQIAKLKAARQGVEYRTLFASCADLDTDDPNCFVCSDYDDYIAVPPDETLTIIRERGNSNIGSTSWCVESNVTGKIPSKITLDLSSLQDEPMRYSFNPDGTLGAESGTVNINPTSDVKGQRCGRIVVTPFGRIRAIQGNWDAASDTCKPIR